MECVGYLLRSIVNNMGSSPLAVTDGLLDSIVKIAGDENFSTPTRISAVSLFRLCAVVSPVESYIDSRMDDVGVLYCLSGIPAGWTGGAHALYSSSSLEGDKVGMGVKRKSLKGGKIIRNDGSLEIEGRGVKPGREKGGKSFIVQEIGMKIGDELVSRLLSGPVNKLELMKARLYFHALSVQHKEAVRGVISDGVEGKIEEDNGGRRFRIHQFCNIVDGITSDSKTEGGKRVLTVSKKRSVEDGVVAEVDGKEIEELVQRLRATVAMGCGSKENFHALLSVASLELPDSDESPNENQAKHETELDLWLADLGEHEGNYWRSKKAWEEKRDELVEFRKREEEMLVHNARDEGKEKEKAEVVKDKEENEGEAEKEEEGTTKESELSSSDQTPNLADSSDEMDLVAPPPSVPSSRDLITPPPTTLEPPNNDEEEEEENEGDEEDDEDDTYERDGDHDDEDEDSESHSDNDEENEENGDDMEDDASASSESLAFQQMLEMGFPPEWCSLALRRVGGSVEAAIHFCFERSGEMDALLEEERERERERVREQEEQDSKKAKDGDSSKEDDDEEIDEDGLDDESLKTLLRMGYPDRWIDEALSGQGKVGIKGALAYIMKNLERLSAQDCVLGNEDNKSKGDKVAVEGDLAWSGMPCPLRKISGGSRINRRTMELTGVAGGGFASVGTSGSLIASGKWYYEVVLETSGCMQIGWADACYNANSDRGDGCGDGIGSWAFDGWRCYKWHKAPVPWGSKWRKGDVIGVGVDMEERTVSFWRNGLGEESGCGLAFTSDGFKPCGGVRMCLSFNRKEKCRVVLGGEHLKDGGGMKHLPQGYKPLGDFLMETHSKYLDFSGSEVGNELFAHQHRYNAADASVHLGGTGMGRRRPGEAERWVDRDEDPRKEVEEEEEKARFKYGLAGYKLCVLYAKRGTLEVLRRGEDVVNASNVKDVFRFIKTTCSSVITGEAGAMALSAECLGLGCSGFESGTNNGFGVLLMNEFKENLLSNSDDVSLGRAAEFAFCFGGFQCLPFLKRSLVRICAEVPGFKDECIKEIEKTIANISKARYGDKDDDDDDDGPDNFSSSPLNPSRNSIGVGIGGGDIRFASWLSGLLLSTFKGAEGAEVRQRLFEGWAGGLLSPSMPFRMISANHSSVLLREGATLSAVSEPKVKDFFKRLTEMTVRRIWAERAAAPVYSKYLQALVELLLAAGANSSIRNVEHPDNTVPSQLPRPYLGIDDHVVTDDWVTFKGEMIVGEVEDESFKQIHQSKKFAIRALMDGGEGPPFLDVGMTVMRGPDWKEEYGVEDGWEVKVEEKKKEAEVEKEKPKEEELEEEEEEEEEEKEQEEKNERHDYSEDIDDDASALSVNSSQAATSPQQQQLTSNISDDDATAENENDDAGSLATVDAVSLATDAATVETGGDDNTIASINTEQSEEEARAAEAVAVAIEERERERKERKKKKKKIQKEKRRKKLSLTAKSITGLPELPTGTVVEIVDYAGVKGGGRLVRWDKTGEERTYRWGVGGCFDLTHVEVNKEKTKTKLRYAAPDSNESYAARSGFGKKELRVSAVLKLKSTDNDTGRQWFGFLELPHFGAGIQVRATREDNRMTIKEEKLLWGAGHVGWVQRFGQASFVPGLEHDFLITNPTPDLQRATLTASTTFLPATLRTDTGGELCVESSLKLSAVRGTKSVLSFDSSASAENIMVSSDKMSCWATSSECRGLVYANVGFTTGQHYWEVKVESGEAGNVFVGISEKPNDENSKFQRWTGMGFVNFRATTHSGAERIYGCHYHPGDTVGVILDCDAGRLSFFLDGIKYGEHCIADLGPAFEGVSPFGFAGEGLGSGGLGMGAPNGGEGRRMNGPKGVIKPLYPVIGLKGINDRVTLNSKYVSTIGTQIHPLDTIHDVVRGCEILQRWKDGEEMPAWFNKLSFEQFETWKNQRVTDELSRGNITLRMSKEPVDVIEACVNVGLQMILLPGDVIRVKRSSGRVLELREEATILGAHNGNLYYKLFSQKGEGGSLVEGGGRAWQFGACDCIDDGFEVLKRVDDRTLDISLPLSREFCGGKIKVVYGGGAVVRTDLEIDLDSSKNIGTLEEGEEFEYLERRVNSCAITRYKVKMDLGAELGGNISRAGWCSGRIRGGGDDLIVEEIGEKGGEEAIDIAMRVALQLQGIMRGESQMTRERDFAKEGGEEIWEQLVEMLNEIMRECGSDYLAFDDLSSSVAFGLGIGDGKVSGALMNQIALKHLDGLEKGVREVMIEIGKVVTLNKIVARGLPLICLRCSQEGTALFGGLNGSGGGNVRVGDDWVVGSCAGDLIVNAKKLLTMSTKAGHFNAILQSTVTPTAPSHDEYEIPREIKTIKVNRIAKKKSVVAQMYGEMKNWNSAAFRRCYVARGSGGQARFFRIKLIGEGADDHGGPMRALFDDVVEELLGEGVGEEGDDSEWSIFAPTENNRAGIGEGQNLHMLKRKGKADGGKGGPEERALRREMESRMRKGEKGGGRAFVGKLFGSAVRLKIPLNLRLGMKSFWDLLVKRGSEKMEEEDLEGVLGEVDYLGLKQVKEGLRSAEEGLGGLGEVELREMKGGMGAVVPIEIFPLFGGSELRSVFCGNEGVNVGLLRDVTELEGWKEDDVVVGWLWDILTEMTNEERVAFLKFVWARTALPSRKEDFDQPFKLQKKEGGGEGSLVTSSTCFFSLCVPEYSSKEIFAEKLIYAINSSPTLDADFVTSAAELASGYGGL